jgi:hypothetical protein
VHCSFTHVVPWTQQIVPQAWFAGQQELSMHVLPPPQHKPFGQGEGHPPVVDPDMG